VEEGTDKPPTYTPTHKTKSRSQNESQTEAFAIKDHHNATFSTSTSPLQNNSTPSSTLQEALQQQASTKQT